MGKGGEGLGMEQKMEMEVVPSVKCPEYQVSRVNISCGHWGGLSLNLSICKIRELDWPTSGPPRARGCNRKGPDSSRYNLGLGRVGSSWSSSGAKGNILLQCLSLRINIVPGWQCQISESPC